MSGPSNIGLFGPPLKRRVFFSFHYENDIWRANVVRNSWRYQHLTTRQAYGFFDASLWENVKRHNPESLKDLIRQGMENTSVTAVLIGSNTYERRWVRYEIARSVVKRNGLVGVRIHLLADRFKRQSYAGPNPLDYMGVYKTDTGALRLAELKSNGWQVYSDYTNTITLPSNWLAPIASYSVTPLSVYATTYCYITNSGKDNFGKWVAGAAVAAAR